MTEADLMAQLAQAKPIPARQLLAFFAERQRATQTLAMREATKAVKQQLAAQGIKLQSVTHREIVRDAERYLGDHPELIPAAQATVDRWAAAGVLGKRAQRAFSNLTSDAQPAKPPISTTSALQISGAK